ncbi:amino acid ABC transporter permease [Ottowia testudinis]|uniref:Amino acid ABC transporter permease n=1 Tax=Ottowia testudinis TaxID=2816950 RepID=A0A975H559_9BURK|nr:amino acid ABC transporter permease [Ottowia testudinis]QTD47100.1 amino acid ABC transporter permease [Ottowia testudinis]
MTEIAWSAIVTALLLAARWTVLLSLIAFAGGALVGLALLLARLAERRAVNAVYRGYIELFQGTPLLMQLFLVFFGLPMLGLEVSAWTAVALGLTLHASAYLADIWLGCVQAIPRSQWAAGASLGMTHGQQLRLIVAPQALRIAVAPTVGFMVQLIKGTALASIIGFAELTKTGNMLANVTLQPFAIYALVGVLYFVLCFPLTWASRVLERRLRQARAV